MSGYAADKLIVDLEDKVDDQAAEIERLTYELNASTEEMTEYSMARAYEIDQLEELVKALKELEAAILLNYQMQVVGGSDAEKLLITARANVAKLEQG